MYGQLKCDNYCQSLLLRSKKKIHKLLNTSESDFPEYKSSRHENIFIWAIMHFSKDGIVSLRFYKPHGWEFLFSHTHNEGILFIAGPGNELRALHMLDKVSTIEPILVISNFFKDHKI